ncbi:MAG: hypothetical protein JJU25_11360 [Halomonas sp.]|nr:hypothetical protein [Halomonas sp.]MCC5883222.1 hypothetical protein [Halomonas sp.]
MNEAEYLQVIEELDRVISDTRDTMARYEAAGMDAQMPEDYDKLHEIYAKAVKEQRACTLFMLNL